MRNETRAAFNAYVREIANLNGVPDASTKFTVAPAVQQKLEKRIQQSSAFLQRINMIGVDAQSGEKIGLGIGQPIASTTDTSKQDRTPIDPASLDGNGYMCTQTNFDTALRYSRLDAWAHLPEFQTLIRDAIVQRTALDRICVGFNGTSRAPTSDRAANPLLQDVNVGWLQKYRLNAVDRVMQEAVEGSKKVKVGNAVGADYKNLDALVIDALQLLDEWYRDDPSVVVVMGSGLLHDKYFPLVNGANVATEQAALDLVISAKRVGGKQAISAPFFPANTLMVTRLDNLSIYYQNGGRRRSIIDNPKRDQIENYESSNEAYVVEDYGCGAIVENIEIEPGA
ncbi:MULTISPECIES: phage major capsid protein, P2 family [Burkholderia cepacia complex]|uniref:phage major capsid protein, P2 family n=1 Tax=Burkholderia cepacia complex TaxID=87882 RepID=UPI000D0075DA|nr:MULTISPECIES: phage major capsid protein, P2 family [Burkholderia cepacia complex]MCA8285523.1 phage major capsid protein, P2 family [Burkholderia vietnamiensis]PRF49904.1 phage major capsid protein, P2 family [Burkholderia multivorans]